MDEQQSRDLAMALFTGQLKDMSYLSPDPEIQNSVMFQPEPQDIAEEAFFQPDDVMPWGALSKAGLLGLALAGIKPVSRVAEYLPDAVKLAQKRVVEPVVNMADDAATIAISDMAREMAFKKALIDPELQIQKIYSPAGHIKIMENAQYSPAQNSIYEWLVDESMRGQGHGAALLDRALADYAELGAQASSPQSLRILYNRGFRNPEMPDATLDDLERMRQEATSVYLQK